MEYCWKLNCWVGVVLVLSIKCFSDYLTIFDAFGFLFLYFDMFSN